MSTDRLDKRLADLSPLSRATARLAIKAGRVCLDGACVRDPADRSPGRLSLDGRPLDPPPLLAVFHKPLGVQCTVGDPEGRPSLAEAAVPLLALGLHPVGRLDADTDGLLPWSADGTLTQRLLHPRHGVEKVYQATVEGVPDPEIGARLAAGVETALGCHEARLIELSGPRITLAVHEGKHRMVRRMLANLGHPVLALRRLSFGELTLGALEAGAWRPANADELAWAADLLA